MRYRWPTVSVTVSTYLGLVHFTTGVEPPGSTPLVKDPVGPKIERGTCYLAIGAASEFEIVGQRGIAARSSVGNIGLVVSPSRGSLFNLLRAWWVIMLAVSSPGKTV